MGGRRRGAGADILEDGGSFSGSFWSVVDRLTGFIVSNASHEAKSFSLFMPPYEMYSTFCNDDP